MCPACLSTMALIAVGTGSTGGVTALLARKLLGKNHEKTPAPKARTEAPTTQEKTR